MMVLRHLGPPSTAVGTHEIPPDDAPIPMDLSNKHHSSAGEIPRHLTRNPYISSAIRPHPSPRTTPSNLNHTFILNNNNNNDIKCNSPHSQSSNSEESSPRGRGDVWRMRRKDLTKSGRWGDINIIPPRTEDEINSHSSPDSGLHRESPGDDEDLLHSRNASTPPLSLRKHGQNLIPLSIIRARYQQPDGTPVPEEEMSSPSPKGRAPDKVLTKRARLEEMVSQIKTTKDRSRKNSGDDDTSSGGHGTSSDEILDEGRDLRASSFHHHSSDILNLKRNNNINEEDMMDDEPCNLVCSETRVRGRRDDLQFEGWKNNPTPPKPNDSFSPTEAAKLLGMDPEAYQQQLMQLQLTSAAMLGDPSAMLKGMPGPYPPWVYLGYYSQILQSFQAQEILRQYAMQSNPPLTPNVSQGDTSPTVSRNLGSGRYNCQSPLSPASLSEGPTGMDSDGSTVGHANSGSANNGKRAPRAMTGRHVRTGTGASPATLQTLRQKIEERQRMKAQQARNEMLNQQNSKMKNSKVVKKSVSKK